VFYKKVRAICKKEGIPFVVDETRTGFGQSGKMWAHEHWYLNETNGGCADFVSFGGKTGISGFFSTAEHRLNPHCASYNQDVNMV
jgi:4-aminobutyrate aminotransferase/(S)-3-amino-2-methylpropionate transaminase